MVWSKLAQNKDHSISHSRFSKYTTSYELEVIKKRIPVLQSDILLGVYVTCVFRLELELYLVAGQAMATIERDHLTWDALNLPVNFLPFLNSVKTCIVMLLQADCSTWPALFEYTGWLRHRRVF